MATVNSRASTPPPPFFETSVGAAFRAQAKFSSPINARLPLVAEPNSHSMRLLSFRSLQPSLEPTKPQLTRENPQLAPMASDHDPFHASTMR